MLLDAGLTKAGNRLRCYVLIGYKGDTFEKAQKRMGEAWRAGFMPSPCYQILGGKIRQNMAPVPRAMGQPDNHLLQLQKIFRKMKTLYLPLKKES